MFQAFSRRYPKIKGAWEQIAEAGREGPLEERTVRLVKLGIAIGALREGAVHSNVRKALGLGISKQEIEQVVALTAGTLGLPATVAVYSWVQDVLKAGGCMRKKIKMGLILFLTVLFAFSQNAGFAAADEEVQELKQQVQQLLKRIEQLEQQQSQQAQEIKEQKEDVAKKTEPAVQLDKLTSKLKIKGRYVIGFYDSGKAGSFPSGSFEAPEAKIQFAFEPDEIHKMIMRLNLNNATFNNVDFFYLDSDIKKLLNLDFPLSSRIGRFKVDFGEETFSDNPVDNVMASNSAGRVAGNDEGLQLSGKIGKTTPIGYSVTVTNGTTGTGSDTSTAKSFAGKLSYNILDPLYVSASYYDSGDMKLSSAEVGPAGLLSRPTGALRWDRRMWEVDLRYDFRKGKTLNPPAYSDSKAIFRLAYGQFLDGASTSTGGIERDGQYGFIEGTYNMTAKIYLATRLSLMDLDGGDTTASLNSITANRYDRYSFGLGYRLTSNTIFKFGYDVNYESGVDVENADNDLVSAIIASQF